jgi:hypothetical protein
VLQPLDDIMEELREHVRREIRMGFTPADEVAEVVLDIMDDGDREGMRAAVEHLIRVEGESFRRDQATWPAETDCDRLDRAFDELERRGIVARQHFSCCQNCGSQEILAEVDDAEDAGMVVRGHAYYHQQDTEGAADGFGLYVAYGSAGFGTTAEVGAEVAAVLAAHGFEVDWDGSPETRLYIPLDWQRRRDDM